MFGAITSFKEPPLVFLYEMMTDVLRQMSGVKCGGWIKAVEAACGKLIDDG